MDLIVDSFKNVTIIIGHLIFGVCANSSQTHTDLFLGKPDDISSPLILIHLSWQIPHWKVLQKQNIYSSVDIFRDFIRY